MGLLGLLGVLLALGGFMLMSRAFKVIFIVYVAGSVLFTISVAGHASLGESLAVLNLAFGAIGLLAFGAIWSQIEARESKRKFVMFVLKYGFVYLTLITGAKLALFLYSGSYTSESWDGISALVALVPYKWLVFLIVVALYHGSRNKRHSSGVARA